MAMSQVAHLKNATATLDSASNSDGTGSGTASSSQSIKEDRELIPRVDGGASASTFQAMETDEDGKDNEVGKTKDARVRKEQVTPYVWFLTGMISISGLLFGLDTGIISGILVSVGTDLGHTLTNSNKELITSATTAAAFIGGIASGIISDKIGRKWLLSAADIFFILGAVIQAVSHNIATITAGRAILGLGVGMASCVCPLLISELAPTHLRGRLVTINVVAITFGQVIAYAIGAAFENTHGGWRWMSGLCAIPAGIQMAALYYLPDSPRQMIVKGRLTEAGKALRKIYPKESAGQIEAKVAGIQEEARDHALILASQPFTRRLKDIILIGPNRRALVVACGLQLLQQLSGFNTLMYYSATLFASIGFNNPTAVGLIVSGTNFIGTLFALKYVDIIGRRRILTWTAPGMTIGLTLAAVSFHFLTLGTGGKLDPAADYPAKWSGLVLFSMIFYVFAYATGVGNLPWQQSELFPISYRGIGTSLATGCNWGSNLIIGSTYLSLMDAITPSGAFGLYGGICFLGWIFAVFCYPETAGLDIEETQIIFAKDFGIKASQRYRAEKRAAYMNAV